MSAEQGKRLAPVHGAWPGKPPSVSTEQGDVETIKRGLRYASLPTWNDADQDAALAALDRLAAALERAELDRDEAIESWQYWRAHGDRELRTRAEKAERALGEMREAIATALTSLATGPAKDGYAYSVLDVVLGPSEASDES